ncbi:hypothetical protein Tco_0155895 [Tanacetum coccineum]
MDLSNIITTNEVIYGVFARGYREIGDYKSAFRCSDDLLHSGLEVLVLLPGGPPELHIMLLRQAYGLGFPEPNVTFALCTEGAGHHELNKERDTNNCTMHEVLKFQSLTHHLTPKLTSSTLTKFGGVLIDTAIEVRLGMQNFETLMASHFFKRARDILLECKDYTDGLQVGCLVSSSKCSSSIEFRNDVASIIKPLVNAFCKIGAKEAQKFLYLSEKKTLLPEYDPISVSLLRDNLYRMC